MPYKTGPSFNEKLALRVLSLSAALYVLLFFSACCLKYYGFIYDDFDLAIHDQIIWNILHGRIFNSILGCGFLGNHVHFISFLVAPFYALCPHPLFLLFLQTVFLAAGVYPLYALARRYLDSWMSLVIGLVYLFYPGLGYTNLYEYHPTCFATFFLLCTAYYFYKENFCLFNVFMVLSLVCQENIALIFIMWGVYACFLKRGWKWVLWPAGLGLAYFLFCVYIVLPAFNQGTFNFFQIYGSLGSSLGEVIKTCLSRPLFVLSIIFQPHKIYFLFQLFQAVAFTALFSPLALLPVFLIFLQHLMSDRLSEVSWHYHYTAELIPFIFVAMVFGVKRLTRLASRPVFLGLILILNAVVVHLCIGPDLHLVRAWEHIRSDDSVAQKQELLQLVPKDAAVVATFEFLPHLSHREDLYSFHHVYSGFFTLFTKHYQLPDNVQYALIDFNDFLTFWGFYGYDNYRNIDSFLGQGHWGTMKVEDNIVLLKKGIPDQYPLFNFVKAGVIPSHPSHTVVDGRMELLGYDFSRAPDRIHLVFYWKLLQPEKKDVNVWIGFIGHNGNIIYRQTRPICYRIWPTQAWGPGQCIEEHQYISVPPGLKGRLQALKIGFFDFNTGKFLPAGTKDRLIEVPLS